MPHGGGDIVSPEWKIFVGKFSEVLYLCSAYKQIYFYIFLYTLRVLFTGQHCLRLMNYHQIQEI